MKKRLCAMLLAVLLLSGCMEPVEIPDAVPQERMRWQNPHGWGLEPETGPYNGFY